MSHELTVLEPAGPRTIPWKTGDGKVARETFDRLRKEGLMAIETKPDGSQEQINEFDPAAERITMMRPLVGG